jgi:hypothetical protein
MATPALPPAGVSEITERGRISVDQRNTRSAPARSVDPIQHAIDKGLVTEVTAPAPTTAGVTRRVPQRIHEIKHRVKGAEVGIATWVSSTGETHRFRYKDARTGKMLDGAMFQVMFIVLRELALDPTGNAALAALSAFKINFKDTDENPIFPITSSMIQAARVGSGPVVAEDGLPLGDLDGGRGGFGIGEDQD